MQRIGTAAPGRVLSIVIVVALLAATVTQAIGLHAVFGGFVAGLALAGSARVNARTRMVVEDFVTNVFAPVFFASLGLRVDFAAAFDLRLCALVLVLATVPKVLGCALGARFGGMRWRQAAAVGFGMNARGADGHHPGRDRARRGPLARPDLRRARGHVARDLADERARDEVAPLSQGARGGRRHPAAARRVRQRAQGREPGRRHRRADARPRLAAHGHEARRARRRHRARARAPTGLGDEVAIPHAAVEGLERPLLALGRSRGGIDFDAPDGRPARVVFLLLIPPKAYEEEVRILASIARATHDARAREELRRASGLDEVTRVLAESAKRTRESMRSKPKRRVEREA